MGNSSLLHWVRVDINWLAHPKARRAGIEGRALWLAGLLWSARMETDGAIPADVVDLLATEAGILVGIAQESATRLMEAGLWDRTADGWQIHDFERSEERRVGKECA